MEKVKYKGKFISVKEFFKEIFGEVPTNKVEISIKELKSYANADIFSDDDLANLQTVKTAKDLENFINNPKTHNLEVKDFLKACLNMKNISFIERSFTSCNKAHVSLIFSNIFDFGEGPGTQPTDTTTTTTTTITTTLTPTFDLDSMQKILDRCKRTIRDDIDVTQFELTEKMPVDLMNDFYMIIPKDLNIYYNAVAIITKNAPNEVAAVGSLQLYEGKTHIILKAEGHKNINYEFFKEQTSFYIVLFPQDAKEQLEKTQSYSGTVYLTETQIDLKQLERSKTTLCIDFGTSNTTVGTYGVKNSAANSQEILPEIVEFLDKTGDKPIKRKMLPTVVYVESLKGDSIKYLFGYAALKRVIEKDYNPDASVFYEIKRWINSIDEEENVTDEKGLKTKISHREIIKAYIEYVLDLAEQYFERRFTKLHFTAPVKLKDSFIAEMTKMFSNEERTVLSAGESIDEGIAIIYNHISEQMKKKVLEKENAKNKKATYDDDKSQKVLIIDCGGGTTDLASCEYTLNTEGYSKSINIVTRFENGDSNFGGNNITFRIFQLLKIKLAQKLKGSTEEISVQTLIEDENKILIEIDKNHAENTPPKDDRKICYKKFDKQYELAEKFVPTKFAQENVLRKKSNFKRNFYYLWQMAEAYKVQFYRASNFVSVDFSDPEDRKIGIPDDNKYYLYVRHSEDGELEKMMNPMSGIVVTNNEIHRLLYADIYALLKNVLYSYDTSNNEQELLKYNHYKLSGQSCKITLFNELLKEFIPGKYLRYGEDKNYSFDSMELKLACINGSIYYMRDTEYGEIKPYIKMETPNLIYDIGKLNVGGNVELYMLKSREEKIEPTVDVISSEARLVRYAVISQNGKRQNTIDFEIEKGHETNTTIREIRNAIAWRSNDEDGEIGRYITDKLLILDLNKENLENVFALFTVPSKNGYGFYVYCVKVQNQGTSLRYFWMQGPKYYSFENTALETFFNGDR